MKFILGVEDEKMKNELRLKSDGEKTMCKRTPGRVLKIAEVPGGSPRRLKSGSGIWKHYQRVHHIPELKR